MWNSVSIHVYLEGEAILHRQDVGIIDLYKELEQVYFANKQMALAF